MEEERFCSGWCRQLDDARRVLFEYAADGFHWRIVGADCAYTDCPFASECPVAAQAREYET